MHMKNKTIGSLNAFSYRDLFNVSMKGVKKYPDILHPDLSQNFQSLIHRID